LLVVPLSAQFAIPPAGVGAAVYGVSEFGAVRLPDDLVRVFWSSRGATWSVPLSEALEPGMPALVPGSVPPVAEVVVGETLLAAAECESEAGIRSVCLQRFGREGVLLDSILVDENAHAPMIAATGGDALFVFIDGTSPPFRVIAVPVGEDGLPGARIDLGPWAQFSHAPSLAASRGSFYVAWSDGSFRLAEIRGGEIVRTLPLTGTIGDEVIHHYDIAGSDEGILILASIGTGVGTGTIRAKVLDSADGWIDISTLVFFSVRAKAVAVPAGWIAAWYEGGSIRARRIGIDGTLGAVSDVSEGRKEVGGLDLEPHASGAIAFFRVRQGAGAFDSRRDDLRMRVLDFDARPVAPSSIVSLAPAPQVMPDGAWDGSSYLVVWNERDTEGFWRVRGARLSAAGELLSRIDFPFEGKDQLHPAIGFNGESHLVVWSEGPSGVDGVAGG
ncbi:MAG: hypothetical protein LC732_04705, partial [Acidobacteria bacterium]|nr:hypothetical protein [Acidobacteriota bacterium]